MKYRAEFIGSGYECTKLIIVEAESECEAIEKVKAIYEKNGWDFWYDYVEAKPSVVLN